MKLTVEQLSFSYPERSVLKKISFQLRPGLTAVLGPNGVGKSTLFQCLLGLRKGYDGSICYGDREVSQLSARELAQIAAYIPQSSHPAFSYRVFDVVLMGAGNRLHSFASPGRKECDAAREALEMVGISHLSERNYLKLSGGEQQLVLLARALAQQTEVLIMDEPTASLDYGNQIRVMQTVHQLAQRGYTILLSTHNPQSAMSYADRVLVLYEGCVLADGLPEQVITASLLERLYGVETQVKGNLVLPGRARMEHWGKEQIRYMRDASEYGDYHRRLAEILLPYLPVDGHVCEAGCGLGDLAHALSPYVTRITACDSSRSAVKEMERRFGATENLQILCGAVEDHPPQIPYDAMIFCQFGAPELILRVAKEQCCGKVCVVSRAGRQHRFSGGQSVLHSDYAGRMERMLLTREVPFQKENISLEFGQPFRSFGETKSFFALYNCGDRMLSDEEIRRRIVETGEDEFPLYLPEKKELTLLCFDSIAL